MNSAVVTRFAPSPTGFLHIGGARTALFNFLYARHTGGKFLLRIEDTDRKRSTSAAVDAIFQGLQWLGLEWDDETVSQFSRRDRHTKVAKKLLDAGKAYRCYCTPEELAVMRDTAKTEGKTNLYDGRWRERDPSDAPVGVEPVIRLKSPLKGNTIVNDLIQGMVSVANTQIDDMILLRADGTPTYMLAVVVDDHDMNISHIIRGDDHLTNTFRQIQIFDALGWELPNFAHMPLLHGSTGGKLSKRHGARSVIAYKEMGFLPEAMNNYLLRLGWAKGDEEIIERKRAVQWFDIKDVGRSPAKFNFEKLSSLNSIYLRRADDQQLATLVMPIIENSVNGQLAGENIHLLERGMPGLKKRAKNIVELAENARFYVLCRPIPINDKASKVLDKTNILVLGSLRQKLSESADWSSSSMETVLKRFAQDADIKLGILAAPLRAALTGTTVSPGIFEVLAVLGKDQSLGRIDDVLKAP